MTKVIQSTIAERQSEAASVPLNFESKVFRQRTGLFDTGATTALATVTPFTPLSYEGEATATRGGTIATANIPVVAGLTHGAGEKLRFVGPQTAPRAADFRLSGRGGIGRADNETRTNEAYGLGAPRKPRFSKQKGETKEEAQARFEERTREWENRAILPGVYYRAYKEGLVDWLLGIDPITSRNQWSGKDTFNESRLDYWSKTVPQVYDDEASYVRNQWMSTEAVPFAGDVRSATSAGYGKLEGRDIMNTANAPVMIDAALPIGIRQFKTDEIASNYIANNKNRVVIGYTIGSRNVKLFYTPAAIDMVVRRFNSIYQLFGTMNPRISYLGRGHLRTNQVDKDDPQGYELWEPATSDMKARESSARPYLVEPNLNWSCGAVPHATKQLPANGPIYIDPNQFPYSQRKRFCKYNHVMTQIGLSMMETLNAYGAGLGEQLQSMSSPFGERDSSSKIAGLQMLFAALYGTSPVTSLSADDFTEDAGRTAAHSRASEIMGMFFNPGHSHIDPGVLVYQNAVTDDGPLAGIMNMITSMGNQEYQTGPNEKWDTAFNNASGLLDTTDTRYNYCDMKVSAACLMNEAIGRLFVFSVMGSALAPHMTVPTMLAKLEYQNNAARETVIDVLKMAHRPGVYADGSGGPALPFDFIDSRITDQVIGRVPCYLRATQANKGIYNSYIGISTPDLMGEVVDKVSEGGVCVTMLEGDDIQFTPIVRGTSGSMVTKRKGVTINIVHLNRPEYYEPGVSKLGAIYGLMSDNASVGGFYFIQPSTGVFHDDRVDYTMYRALAGSESKQLYALINPDVSRESINRQTAWYEARGLSPWKSFSYIPIDENGNIDWAKWQLMYKDAGIDISKEQWTRAINQDINMSRNSALYPPAAPSFRTAKED